MPEYPHAIAPLLPDGSVPSCQHCQKGADDPHFDPNGECESHRKDALIGLKLRTEADADRSKYVHAYGVEGMNKRAAAGYRVVAAWSYGAESTALMERIDE